MENIFKNWNKKKMIVTVTMIIILLIIIVSVTIIRKNDINKIIKNTFLKSQEEILSYEIYSNNIDENIQILVRIETEEGIKQIESPDGNIIYGNGRNVIYVDYNVKKDENYVFRTTKNNGEVSEDTVKVTDDDLDKVSDIVISFSVDTCISQVPLIKR